MIIRGTDVRFDGFVDGPELEFIPPVDAGRIAMRDYSEKLPGGLSYSVSMDLEAEGFDAFIAAVERRERPEPPLLTATFKRPCLRVSRRRDRTRSRLSTATSQITGKVVGGGLDACILELTLDTDTRPLPRRAVRGLGRRR